MLSLHSRNEKREYNRHILYMQVLQRKIAKMGFSLHYIRTRCTLKLPRMSCHGDALILDLYYCSLYTRPQRLLYLSVVRSQGFSDIPISYRDNELFMRSDNCSYLFITIYLSNGKCVGNGKIKIITCFVRDLTALSLSLSLLSF